MIHNIVKTVLFIFVGLLFGLWVCDSYAAKYEYDALNRLTRVVYDSGSVITYTYDKVGNRTTKVSTLMADASIDGVVNFYDFAVMASHWLEDNCGYANEWCQGADLNWSSKVDIDDLATLVDHWLESTSP